MELEPSARWSPRSVDYLPGDGRWLDPPVVGVWFRGEWRVTVLRFQQWATATEDGQHELLKDWWCFVQTSGHVLRVPANDLDWGEPDPAAGWLAERLGLPVEEAVHAEPWG